MKNDKKQRHEKSADVSKTAENYFNNENRILFSIEEKNMYLTNTNYKNLEQRQHCYLYQIYDVIE